MLTRPALDLTRYHFRHLHGDITAYGTWWLAEDSGPRPCLVLLPTHKQSWEKTRPCVVMLDQAWVWSEEIGDPFRAARNALDFADALGLGASPSNGIRVRSIIVDHLDDLLKMPVMPEAMRVNTLIGEAKVTAREAGRVIRHEEIVDRV
jgi:hypothetical protein